MSNPASIPLRPDPPGTTLISSVGKWTSKAGWRLLSDKRATCSHRCANHLARPVTECPPCEKFDVIVCRWGIPTLSNHPANTGSLSAVSGRRISGLEVGWVVTRGNVEDFWRQFLVQKGNLELWKQVADDEMREHWLVSDKDEGQQFGLDPKSQKRVSTLARR